MNLKLILILLLFSVPLKSKKMTRKLLLKHALQKINSLSQNEKEIKFQNLQRYLLKKKVTEEQMNNIKQLYFSKEAHKRKLLLSVLGPMLIPDLTTTQILTLMGIDFIGYSLLGNFMNDQKIVRLSK